MLEKSTETGDHHQSTGKRDYTNFVIILLNRRRFLSRLMNTENII